MSDEDMQHPAFEAVLAVAGSAAPFGIVGRGPFLLPGMAFFLSTSSETLVEAASTSRVCAAAEAISLSVLSMLELSSPSSFETHASRREVREDVEALISLPISFSLSSRVRAESISSSSFDIPNQRIYNNQHHDKVCLQYNLSFYQFAGFQ